MVFQTTRLFNSPCQKMHSFITEDKDFGDELIYKKSSKNIGSLLLRLMDVPIEMRVKIVLQVIDGNAITLKH